MAAPLNLAAAARARKVDAHPTSHRSFFSRVQYAPRAATSLGILLGRAPGRTREAPPQRFHVRSSFQQAQGVTASVFSRAEPPPASTRGRHKRFFYHAQQPRGNTWGPPRAYSYTRGSLEQAPGAAARAFSCEEQPPAIPKGRRTAYLHVWRSLERVPGAAEAVLLRVLQAPRGHRGPGDPPGRGAGEDVRGPRRQGVPPGRRWNPKSRLHV